MILCQVQACLNSGLIMSISVTPKHDLGEYQLELLLSSIRDLPRDLKEQPFLGPHLLSHRYATIEEILGESMQWGAPLWLLG